MYQVDYCEPAMLVPSCDGSHRWPPSCASDATPLTPAMHAILNHIASGTRKSLLATLAILAACEVVDNDAAKKDTTTAAGSGAAVTAAGDTTAAGVPAAPTDTTGAMAVRDTGTVTLSESPTRGGVVFALAEGVATDIPRCSWKGAPLPCYRTERGILAVIPLPADEPAGTFTLAIERPSGRITRQVTVGERDFGRQLVFLDSARWRLVTRGSDIARDARTIRGILSGESAEQRWSGSWRDPVRGKGTGYGAERFYFRAADSSRAISLGSDMQARGAFGLDTSASGNVPSWRHAGVDIAVGRRTAVFAPAAAVVADVGDYTLSGRTLLLDHGQGIFSAYFHLDTVLVRRGDEVSAGRTIGRVGTSGLTTGPHLHYGVYVHGKDVDPAAFSAMPAFARGGAAGRGGGAR